MVSAPKNGEQDVEDKGENMTFDELNSLPIPEQARLVWPEKSLKEGIRRIKMAIAFNKMYPDRLPKGFGTVAYHGR